MKNKDFVLSIYPEAEIWVSPIAMLIGKIYLLRTCRPHCWSPTGPIGFDIGKGDTEKECWKSGAKYIRNNNITEVKRYLTK